MTENNRNNIALIEWSHLIEDFLDNIGVSFEDFKEKMTGGWLFGYIEALKLSGVNVVLFCFSARTDVPMHFTHTPTGAKICVLPATGLYRYIRRVVANPYASTIEEAAGNIKGWKRMWCSFLLNVSPYLATPMYSLYREIKNNNCRAILCQDYEHARFDVCVWVGRFLRLPVFATFQGGNWQMSRYEHLIRPLSLKACAGLIIASGVEIERVKEKYGLQDEKLKQIFNPVDLSMWQGAGKEDTRNSLDISLSTRLVVWHGRVDYHRKGLDVLIDAWEQICTNHPHQNFRLLLIGTGNNAIKLKQRLALAPQNITWINEYINDRKRIYVYLKSADIYAFPSRNEGFPVAPLEGMACGLVLVATNAPGIPDILKDGKASGGLMLPQNDTEAFSAALLELLVNKEKTDHLGRLAALHVQQHFSLEAVGRQLNQFMFKKNKHAGF